MLAKRSSHSKLDTLYQLMVVIALSICLLYFARSLIVPVVFGIFLAMMLTPLTEFYKRFLKFDALAITFSFLTVILPLVGIIMLFGYQLTNVVEGMNSIGERLDEGLETITNWAKRNFGVRLDDPAEIAKENPTSITGWAGGFITGSILSTTNLLVDVLLTLIYTFFLLLFRLPIRNFMLYQLPKARRERGEKFISRVQKVAQQYLNGMLTVVAILAVLNSVGLWIIGVEYAIFWGCLGAFLAIIPYIGTIIGGILPLLYTLATADSMWQPIAVIVLYQIVQAIEGNYITPKIVGSNVQINTLVAVFAIVFWGSIWGIGGVILAIPLTAIMKILLAQLSYFQPLSRLMGEAITREPDVFKERYDDNRYRILSYLEKE